MAHPRHAQQSHVRAAVIAVIAVVVVALVALGIAFWPRLTDRTAGPAVRGTTAPTRTTSASTATGSATPEPTTSASAESSASAQSAAARASLQTCINRVRSTDEVLNQAAIGIHNWSVHVQAQIDADHGRISVMSMDRKFAKTRADGPDDITRYRKALAAQQPVGDACATRSGANAVVTRKLNACQQRIAAQQPVLRTAAVAMGDWNKHLHDMAQHADGKISGAVAEQLWINTYRAAPRHLRPYEQKAAVLAAAPTCT